MKRILQNSICAVLLMQSISIVKAQDISSTDPVYDSIYRWSWGSMTLTHSTDEWSLYNKTIHLSYIQPNTNILISDTSLYWNGSDWSNQTNILNSYDSNNNLIHIQSQTWNATEWLDNIQKVMTFDNSNNLTELLIQSWTFSGWNNLSRTKYTYDSNKNKITEINELWSNSKWTPGYNLTFTYDTNNKLIEDFLKDRLGRIEERFYSYDKNGNLAELDAKRFNAFDSVWVDQSKTKHTYDGNNNRTYTLLETFTDSVFQKTAQSFFTYDGQNNLTQVLNQDWIDTVWKNTSRTLNVYDLNNLKTDNSNIRFNNDQIFDSDSTHYFIKDLSTGIKKSKLDEQQLIIYPNPSSGIFSVKMNDNTKIKLIEVYNLLGEKLLEQQTNIVELNEVAKGVYFVRVNNGERIYQQKLIIE